MFLLNLGMETGREEEPGLHTGHSVCEPLPGALLGTAEGERDNGDRGRTREAHGAAVFPSDIREENGEGKHDRRDERDAGDDGCVWKAQHHM